MVYAVAVVFCQLLHAILIISFHLLFVFNLFCLTQGTGMFYFSNFTDLVWKTIECSLSYTCNDLCRDFLLYVL